MTNTAEEPIAVSCTGVTKEYGATRALSGVDVTVLTGTIHALVGENGAGKSTLLGILAGRVVPSGGHIEILGDDAPLGNPRAARHRGVVAIYQELTIVPALSACANVFLGQTTSRMGVLSERVMKHRFAQLCEMLGVRIDPDISAGRLSVADQQLLEIMRAVQADARLILFDEPTASLAESEREALFRLMNDLRNHGVTMILVSHNLDEVLSISDAITVFRNGTVQDSRPTRTWNKATLIEAMLGETKVWEHTPRMRQVHVGEPLVAVTGLCVEGALVDVNIDVSPGEIVGIAGLVGSGRTTLLRALAGLESSATGHLRIDGMPVSWPHTVRAARKLGIALVPEDRKSQGLVLGASAAENIILGNMAGASRWGVISQRRMRSSAQAAAEEFGFDSAKIDQLARNLSGGNQQKALLARWKYCPPRLLLADEPTRGIDIGAKLEIIETLRNFADSGVAIVVVSSEIEEVISVADRIFVLAEGRVTASLDAADRKLTVENILHHAFKVETAHV